MTLASAAVTLLVQASLTEFRWWPAFDEFGYDLATVATWAPIFAWLGLQCSAIDWTNESLTHEFLRCHCHSESSTTR